MTRRPRGIPGLRADQKQAMATRHSREHAWYLWDAMTTVHGDDEQEGGSMATTKRNTAVLESGELIDTDTGEVLSHNNPEPEPNEAEQAARDLANRDAETDPEMLDLLSHVAVAWMPEVGDKLIGTVVGRYTRDDSKWGPYEIVEIRTASGAVIAWHAFGTVGQSSIIRRNPQPGDRIGITCLHPVETDKGNPYRNYQVIVRKPVRDGTMVPTGNSGGTTVDPSGWHRP